MEHELSPFRAIQPIACLLNPDATCDRATQEKASILHNAIAVEICQRIECRRQVLIFNASDRIPHTKTAILTACGMLDTTCTARRLRKSKPSMFCPIIIQFRDENGAFSLLISQALLSPTEEFRAIKAKAALTRMQRQLTMKVLPTSHNSVTDSCRIGPSSTQQSTRIRTFDVTQSQMPHAPTSSSNLASRITVDILASTYDGIPTVPDDAEAAVVTTPTLYPESAPRSGALLRTSATHVINKAINPTISTIPVPLSPLYEQVCFVTETRLPVETSDSVVSIPGCNIHRCDRRNSKGGGRAIYSKSELRETPIDDSSLEGSPEVIWISIEQTKQPVLIWQRVRGIKTSCGGRLLYCPSEVINIGEASPSLQKFIPVSPHTFNFPNPLPLCELIPEPLCPTPQQRHQLTKSHKKETLLSCLADLFHAITTQKKSVGQIAPKKFISRLKRENGAFDNYLQQDAHEFLIYILNEISDILQAEQQADQQLRKAERPDNDKNPDNVSADRSQNWIQDIFQGCLTNETRCLTCENVRTKDEDFLDLSVDIAQNCSIVYCLKFFSDTEMMQSENKYYCEFCRCKQEAQKCMRVKKPPLILALHLKRFKYSEEVNSFTKLSCRVVFPTELRLPNTSGGAADQNWLYKLIAVVVHSGSGPNRGHYVTLVKSHGLWLLFDDEVVDKHHKLRSHGVPVCYLKRTSGYNASGRFRLQGRRSVKAVDTGANTGSKFLLEGPPKRRIYIPIPTNRWRLVGVRHKLNSAFRRFTSQYNCDDSIQSEEISSRRATIVRRVFHNRNLAVLLKLRRLIGRTGQCLSERIAEHAVRPKNRADEYRSIH
ncbi:ubiquitin carboxyl-terminal hydrolase 12/46 [Clonorchis sinensis]|uniref:ubiquitinyl hydrolase 1 n=1 Tax=Clonorchis sinensis TaxID=79923 RepID=G7YUK5_CLOSI|nr:ubiquitin carboxyl-terminal hydrolase 12/46 [Clonorchis sinensis]